MENSVRYMEMGIIIDNKPARIVSLLDEDAEETTIASKAIAILYQFDEDRRPEGMDQTYKLMHIDKGSLKLAPVH